RIERARSPATPSPPYRWRGAGGEAILPEPIFPSMPPKILLFTGGGTAGHVMPNLALAPRLREAGWILHYAGSESGPERALAEGAGIPFHGVATGKLRRYFSWRNFIDPFR